MIKNYLWTLPFIFFIGGYITVHFLFAIEKISTPALVGKTISQALITLSDYKLNPRILGEKEDADLPDGTIISQTPTTGQTIKPNQSIYLLISKRPSKQNAINMINKKISTIKQELSSHNIHMQVYSLPHTYPHNHCFAQLPAPGDPIKHKSIILYESAGNTVPIIWPNFTNVLITDVLAFLQSHNLYPQIIHDRERDQTHVCTNCRVLHQNPLAGSLITLDPNRPFRIQLRVH